MSETPSTVDDSLSPSVLERVDQVCDCFEDAWLAGRRPHIEDYLGEVSDERERAALLKELIALDIFHRRKQGETPIARDYERFSSLSADWLAGTVSAVALSPARYQFGEEIGRGGMGAVLRGRDLHLGRDLAVKVLREEHRGQAQLQQRFLEEARIGSRLQHPGIVPIHDLSELSDGRPFFTMKLVEGRTLAELLAERADPSRDLPRFLSIFEHICQTLAYAHAQGVIHRDLKPANVMVGAFGEVQVMDWGLAKALKRGPVEEAVGGRESGTGGPALEDTAWEMPTQRGQVMGTLPYMPPEQARGEVGRVDERSDVFGLGAILCKILTGLPPFTGIDGSDIFAKAKECEHAEALARLDTCGAEAELVALAKACLAAEPADRPRDASAVAERVKMHLVGVQERLRATELAAAQAIVRAEEEGKTARQERRARRFAVALSVSVLITLAIGGEVYRRLTVHRAEVRGNAGRLVEQAQWLRKEKNWAAALHAGKEAKGILDTSSGNEDLRQQVDELLAEVEVVQKLEENWLRMAGFKSGHFDEEGAEQDYARIFADFGIDVQSLDPEEVAARIRAHSVWEELAAALDDWAMLRRALRPKDLEGWERLLQIVQLADPTPWRTSLRNAILQKDRAALEKLAANPDVFQQAPRHLHRLGIYLYNTGATEAAINLLEQARRLHHNDFWINENLAFLLHWRTTPPRLDEAIRCYLVARSLRPDSVGANLNLANALMQRGQVDEAIVICEEMIKRLPGYAGAHANLSSAWARKGQLDKAEAAARRAIELQPRLAMAHVNLAHALNEQKKFAQAEAASREAIKLAPDFDRAHGNLGEALFKQGRFADAIVACREAVRLNPNYGESWGNLGASYLSRKETDKALKALRKAIEVFHAVQAPPRDLAAGYTNLGSALSMKGEPDEAIDAYREAIRILPDFAPAHYGLGRVLSEEQRLDEAVAAYQQALKLQPDFAEARWNLGIVQTLQRFLTSFGGKPDPALLAAQKAVQDNSKDALARLQLGNAFLRTGSPQEAIGAFRAAVRLQPRLNLPYLHLALAYKNNRDLPRAIVTLRRGVTAEPDADAYTVLGSLLREARNAAGAIEALEKAIRLNPKHGPAYAELGAVYLDKGDPIKAIPLFKQAVQINPNDGDLLTRLGIAYQDSGDAGNALGILERAVRINTNNAEAHTRLGLLRLSRNDLEGALAACDRALQINPKDNRPHQIRGKALLRKGAVDDAIAAYRRAVKPGQRNPEALFELACALSLKDDPNESIRSFREAIKQKPDYAEAHFMLGNVLLNQGKFAEALREGEIGHKQGFGRPGWVYPSGQWLRYCQHCIELDKQLPAVLSGEVKPASAAEYSDFARICRFKNLNAASARLYEEAFTRDSELATNLLAKHRFYASGAAALAGCGKGRDNPPPTPQAQTRLRRQSLEWLRADLSLWEKLLATGRPRERALVAERMRQWLRNPDLAVLRDKGAVDKLPEAERDACRKLWTDVADLLERAQEK
jgi:serine/threonine-protein kinase